MGRVNSFSVSACAAALALLAAHPAQAQFGFNLGGAKKSSDTTTQGCPSGKKKSVGASILGSMAGSVASRVGGKFASFVPLPEFANILTSAIACKLDEKEQKQAADATLAVTRAEGDADVAVGQTAEWTSSSRENVRGKSTVVARNDDDKGAKCITVSDVIIVNGEETTANKRMCRKAGAARYTLMA